MIFSATAGLPPKVVKKSQNYKVIDRKLSQTKQKDISLTREKRRANVLISLWCYFYTGSHSSACFSKEQAIENNLLSTIS